MKFSKRVAIGGGAAGVLLAGAIYGGTALAQSTPASGSPSANSAQQGYQNFLQHLAARLNITTSQVDSALKGAEGDAIADAVKQGKLTQAQADKITQGIQNGRFPGFAFRGGPGPGRPGPGGPGVAPGQILSAAAGALNLQLSDLQAQLKAGKSLKDIAAAQKVDFAKVQAAISTAVKPGLDQAVKDGKLTQQQETAILNRITSGNVPGRGPGPRPNVPARPRQIASPKPSPSPSPSVSTAASTSASASPSASSSASVSPSASGSASSSPSASPKPS